MNTATQTSLVGVSVIRDQSALHPIVGTIKSVLPANYPHRTKPQATVNWQHEGYTSTSTIDLEKLIEASPEHIADVQTKAKKLTQPMKSVLTKWREHIDAGEFVRLDDVRSRLDLTWEQWYRVEKVLFKLIALGYFEGHEDNRQCNTGNKRYRIAKKHN
jgi:hypothetical protein